MQASSDSKQTGLDRDRPEQPYSNRVLRRHAWLILALFAPVAVWSSLVALRVDSETPGRAVQPTPSGAGAGLTIDPNTAPWWELTVIPGIGEAYAKRIVEYREAHAAAAPGGRVFHHPKDLERVKGIGPRTVEKMLPYLALESPP